MNTGYLTPKEIAEQVAENSRTKAHLPMMQMIMLGLLAGAYIAFGAELCTMSTHDLAPHVGLGLTKFVGGSVFSVGLMLVVLGGGELFTGNCLMLSGVFSRRISLGSMLKNWTVVYLTNFAGSLLLVALIYYSGQWKMGDHAVGAAALTTACLKCHLTFAEAFWRGVGCNWLVCLAVWLGIAGRDAVSKIFGIYFPVMAFVASGFEHSVANMYFIPLGLLLKSNPAVVAAAGLGDKMGALTMHNFLIGNLVPVTLGNIVGGAFFVGGAYYLIYLRGEKPKTE
jgi:formate/nitrite transporter